MQERINGILYDTGTAIMIIESDSLTFQSGKQRTRLFRTLNGQWFKTIGPAEDTDRSEFADSRPMDPVSAKQWLKEHHFTRQLREYFGSSRHELKSERQVLTAEWQPARSREDITAERLYYSPAKGWTWVRTTTTVLIPLTPDEAGTLARSLQADSVRFLSPLSTMESSLYERNHMHQGGNRI